MKKYFQEYLKNRPLFLALIRGKEAVFFQEKSPLKNPVLDFGCGDGFFVKASGLAEDGKLEVGLDIEETVLKKARDQKVYKKTVKYDGEKIPFESAKFKTVISNCVMEHVEELDKNLEEIDRVLKRKGIFICSVMTNKWESYLFGSMLLGGFYSKWMREKQVHKSLLSKKEWEKRFKKAGFKVVKCKGYLDKKQSMWLDFLHYISIPSLISYKIFGKWVLWGRIFDFLPVTGWMEKLTDKKVRPSDAAALFFVLEKQS